MLVALAQPVIASYQMERSHGRNEGRPLCALRDGEMHCTQLTASSGVCRPSRLWSCWRWSETWKLLLQKVRLRGQEDLRALGNRAVEAVAEAVAGVVLEARPWASFTIGRRAACLSSTSQGLRILARRVGWCAAVTST